MSISAAPVRGPWVRLGNETTGGVTMKFMMLICWDAVRMNAQTEPGPRAGQAEDSFPWLDDTRARGISVAGARLAPPRRARTVRVRDGKAMITDGPFAETKEVVGGGHHLEGGRLRG